VSGPQFAQTNDVIQPIQFEDGRAFYNESTGVGNLPGAVGFGVALDSVAATGIRTVEAHNIELRSGTSIASKSRWCQSDG
jgi:hypothetical protein